MYIVVSNIQYNTFMMEQNSYCVGDDRNRTFHYSIHIISVLLICSVYNLCFALKRFCFFIVVI